jgi:hypothetical protein
MPGKTLEEPENLRSWYNRKTKSARRALFGATVITATVSILLWVMAELPFLARMQTFNGAIIIPAAGGIWIAAFMYIWLIPMRELSFRGQESFDRTEARLKTAIDDRLMPAVEIWTRIGARVETVLLPKIEKLVEDAQKTSSMVQERVGPAYESVRRAENTVHGQIRLLASDVGEAAESVKKFFGPQGAPPDLDGAVGFMTAPKPRNGHVISRRS